ncbi:unnamed protein product [Mytilus edulis]|uniref:Uncharacterized protein n=1 Tax=Mytilus edulis TaxID=6550 RepID=A0A8S3QDC6_MYTED|nr:unnamed protein product [Mytilus edulis]
MDAHGNLHESDLLQNAVACLMHETRYQCSVIRDFNLPSNYAIQKPKLPVKKQNTNQTPDRKGIKTRSEKGSKGRFLNTLYKTRDRYREDKKEYSRKRYSNVPYQLSKKRSISEKYKSNTQFKDARKDYIKNRYKSNTQFRQEQKDYTKNKYKFNVQFRQSRKEYIRSKYKSNIPFRLAHKDYILNKYRTNIPFQQAQKYYNKMKYKINVLFQNATKKQEQKKYARDKDYQNRVKTLNLLKYRQNVLFREKCKNRQRQLYRSELKYREKKILLVQQRRTKDAGNFATWFRQQVMDGPRYICSVCIKVKFKKQVLQLDKEKYVKKGKQSAELANRCISFEFKLECTVNCQIKCETINHKLWICYTCHRHLLQNKIPADALNVIPEENL